MCSKFPWGDVEWTERAVFAASLIPPQSTVLELGSGMGHLQKRLDHPRIYVPVDKEKWTPDTLTCDFNERLPNLGRFDFVVALGLVEYLNDPLSFFASVHELTDNFILSYRKFELTHLPRTTRDSPFAIQKKFAATNWVIAKKREVVKTGAEFVWLLKGKN